MLLLVVVVWCAVLCRAVSLNRYNSEVRLSTLRWAVLALLRKPPPGLQEVVKAHFRWVAGHDLALMIN